MRIHRGVAMPRKMFSAGEHASRAQSPIKRGAHSGDEIRIRAKASILCYGTFRIDMQVKHRSKIEIASDGAQFRCHRTGNLLRGFDVPQPSQIRWRWPSREEFSQPLRILEVTLVKNHSRKAAREIFRKFAGEGIAVEAQHESCEYGITRLRFGLGLCVHLV